MTPTREDVMRDRDGWDGWDDRDDGRSDDLVVRIGRSDVGDLGDRADDRLLKIWLRVLAVANGVEAVGDLAGLVRCAIAR